MIRFSLHWDQFAAKCFNFSSTYFSYDCGIGLDDGVVTTDSRIEYTLSASFTEQWDSNLISREIQGTIEDVALLWSHQ